MERSGSGVRGSTGFGLRFVVGGVNPREPLTLSEEKRKLASLYELPRRLMARQQTLDLFIEVRILAGQQAFLNASLAAVPGFSTGLIV